MSELIYQPHHYFFIGFTFSVKGMTDDEVKRIEPWMHLNAVSWGLGTSFASLGLTVSVTIIFNCSFLTLMSKYANTSTIIPLE